MSCLGSWDGVIEWFFSFLERVCDMEGRRCGVGFVNLCFCWGEGTGFWDGFHGIGVWGLD